MVEHFFFSFPRIFLEVEPKIKLDEKTTKRVIEFELRGTSLEADHKILENQ